MTKVKSNTKDQGPGSQVPCIMKINLKNKFKKGGAGGVPPPPPRF
jgi:hypothetical protein